MYFYHIKHRYKRDGLHMILICSIILYSPHPQKVYFSFILISQINYSVDKCFDFSLKKIIQMYANDCPINFQKESMWRVLIVVSRKGFPWASASLWTEVIKICVLSFWPQYVIKVRFFFFFQLVTFLIQRKNLYINDSAS